MCRAETILCISTLNNAGAKIASLVTVGTSETVKEEPYAYCPSRTLV